MVDLFKIVTLEGSHSSSYTRTYYYEGWDTFEYNLMHMLLVSELRKTTNRSNKLSRVWGRLRSADKAESDKVKYVKAAYIYENGDWQEIDYELIPPKVNIK